jgi:hypothetical protein
VGASSGSFTVYVFRLLDDSVGGLEHTLVTGWMNDKKGFGRKQSLPVQNTSKI